MALTAIKWIFVLLVILALQVVTSRHEVTAPAKKLTSKPSINSTTTKDDTPVTTKSTVKPSPSPTPTTANINETVEAKGSNLDDGKKMSSPYNNKGLLKRMLYVAIAFSVIVALYFIVKTIRTKARKSKSKKYGMIYSSGDVEMQPLEDDQDDEDDMTVFDRKTRK